MITLSNEAGELDNRTVEATDTDEGAEIVRAAVIALVDSTAYFRPGDRITISEI
jgi:hypothetical protein